MTKKELIRMIAFGLVVCLMLGLLCDLFENENHKNYDSRVYTYRTLGENTVVGVFIGTSGVDRYWVSSKAYEDHGMTVYSLSVDSMPAWLYPEMLEYALQYQDVKLAILDIRAFTQDVSMTNKNSRMMDVQAHRVLNAFPWFSPIWFRTVFKTMKLIHRVDETEPRFNISLLLSFVRFHQKWQEAGFDFFTRNLGSRIHEFASFYTHPNKSAYAEPLEDFVFDDTQQQALDPIAEEAFYEIIDYAREQGVELLFVDTPQRPEGHEMMRANTVYEKLDELGINYVTYYVPGEANTFSIDLDPETDFYNDSHVNYFGAVKFTDHFAAYISEHYDLADRRNDPQASAYWGGVLEKIEDMIDYYLEHPPVVVAEDDEEEE